jgi:organic radical activating enzyme
MLVMPTIEYNIVEHCNLTCAHCDHASPYMPRNHIPAEVIGKDLARLAEAARFGELKLVGGEPLLHPDLLAVLKVCKSTHVAHKMTLATNGLLLHKLGDDALGLIDQLWISIYPDVKIRADQAELRRRCAQARTRVYFVHMDRFRKTISGKRNDDRELLEKIYRSCPLRQFNWCHTLRQGKYFVCSPASFIEHLFRDERIDPYSRTSGLDIYASQDLRADLKSYLTNTTPLSACRNCLGGVGRRERHRLMPKAEIARGFKGDGAFVDDLDYKQLTSRVGQDEPDFSFPQESARALFRDLSATHGCLEALGFAPESNTRSGRF